MWSWSPPLSIASDDSSIGFAGPSLACYFPNLSQAYSLDLQRAFQIRPRYTPIGPFVFRCSASVLNVACRDDSCHGLLPPAEPKPLSARHLSRSEGGHALRFQIGNSLAQFTRDCTLARWGDLGGSHSGGTVRRRSHGCLVGAAVWFACRSY